MRVLKVGRGIVAAVAVVPILVAAAMTSSADTRALFAPTVTWAWTADASLATTSGLAQYAEATVSGLSDADHNAGFRLRSGATSILVAVSGTAWKVEPSGQTPQTGTFSHASSGRLRATVSTTGLVEIAFGGVPVVSRQVTGSYPDLGVVPVVWQSSTGVRMADIAAGDLGTVVTPTPSATPTVTVTVPGPTVTVTVPGPTVTVTVPGPTVTVTATVGPEPTPSTTSPEPTATGARWLSGAASPYAASGEFGTWRGEPIGIGGTWNDSLEGSTAQWTLTDEWGASTVPIDDAIGAIWKSSGESWSAAATGAYNARWTKVLTAVATARVGKGTTYLRFAHEMNGNWTDWNVKTGEEAAFREAISRFSALRYQIMPEAKIVLCGNDGTSSGQADPQDLFVGQDSSSRQVVDVYCVDTYNQYPHRTDRSAIEASFTDAAGVETHRRFAESVGVPFSVGEWGNCGIAAQCAGGGGESPAYVQAMNSWFREHAGDPANPKPGQLLYEVQFNLWDRFLLYPSSSQPLTASEYVRLPWGI